jgi:hypothetical protein
VYNNKVYDNNHENFAAKGNIVASIPPGTGFMILATHQLELTKNEIRNNKTVGIGVISYDLVNALNEGEVEQEGSIGGVQTVNNNYLLDTLYNPYPYKIFIHDNIYSNSHWFPALGHDIGKLFMMKSFMSPPDIAYDGIANPERANPEFCVQESGDLTVLNLDAAHDFENLTKGLKQFDCVGVSAGR